MTHFNAVKTTTTTTGTGNMTVSATPAARSQALGVIPTGTVVALRIEDLAGTDWEVSLCTILSPTTFSRGTVLAGSNGTSKVNFGVGTKSVLNPLVAEEVDSFLTAASVAALGMPLPDFLAATPGSTVSGTDLILGAQGNNTVGLTALALAAYTLTQLTSARTVGVRITAAATIPFDSSTHLNRPIYVTVAGVTFTGPTSYASVADNFKCKIINQSSGVVTFGAGVTCYGGTTIPAGGMAEVFSTNGAMFAQVFALATAAPDTVKPTETAATVSNANPTFIDISFSEPMNTNAVPATSTLSASGHTLTGTLAWLDNLTLRATVSTAYSNGEAASTLSYTANGTNNLKDLAGNECDNFSAKPITNNVGVVAAVLSSPTGVQTGANSATLGVSTNIGSGTIYWLVDSNATATASAIKASNVTSSVTATGTQTKSIVGLTAATTYYAHMVQVTGSDSNVVNSASFTTSAVGAAPFTVTNRAAFPINRSTYNASGDGNSFFTDVTPTGAATVTGVEFFMSESNSVRPTSGTKTVSPKGDSAVASAFGSGQPNLWQASLFVKFNVTVSLPLYFWIKVTDSNAAVWWFRRTTTTNYLDGVTQTYTTAVESMVAA